MQIFDAHRIIGPTPAGREHGTTQETLLELDRLGIDSAAVTPSWMLYGDPRDADVYEAESARDLEGAADAAGLGVADARLVRVPVVIPGRAGSGWPDPLDRVDAPLIRACPVRHRFDPLGPAALTRWRELADRGTALALDASECGLPLVASVAEAVPELKILVLAPGYRELRRLIELLDRAPLMRVETGTIVAAGGIEWLARAVGAQRLVFGTGAPQWDAAGPVFQLEHLDLPIEDRELIAHGSWELLTGGAL